MIVLVTMVWNRREVIEWIRDPRGVFAVTTGISVARFVAALVMLNIAVWYNPWSVDLTASGRNQVSDDTRRLLQRVEQAGDAAAVRPRVGSGVEQLLRGFERETRRIRVEFVDVDRERSWPPGTASSSSARSSWSPATSSARSRTPTSRRS